MLGSPPGPEPLASESLRAAHTAAVAEARRDPLAALSGWGSAICAAIALGYGLLAFYGSGDRVAALDVSADAGASGSPATAGPAAANGSSAADCPSFGPLALDPSMNPMRVVLRAGYAPRGSKRQHYEIAMDDEAGRSLWDRRGFLGSQDDETSFVKTTTRLMDFEVPRAGDYTFRVQFPEGSMDDLREATLEVRGRVQPVDTRVTWGFGLAAVACLLVNLFSSKRSAHAYDPPSADRREAAVSSHSLSV